MDYCAESNPTFSKSDPIGGADAPLHTQPDAPAQEGGFITSNDVIQTAATIVPAMALGAAGVGAVLTEATPAAVEAAAAGATVADYVAYGVGSGFLSEMEGGLIAAFATTIEEVLELLPLILI